jgi:hypothetical protein
LLDIKWLFDSNSILKSRYNGLRRSLGILTTKISSENTTTSRTSQFCPKEMQGVKAFYVSLLILRDIDSCMVELVILLNFMFGKMRISHHLLNLYDWVLCKIATLYTSMEAEKFSLGLETMLYTALRAVDCLASNRPRCKLLIGRSHTIPVGLFPTSSSVTANLPGGPKFWDLQPAIWRTERVHQRCPSQTSCTAKVGDLSPLL